MKTIEGGPASMVWQSEGFAIAAGVDVGSGRYRGLIAGSHATAVTPQSLLVKPEFAIGQMEAEADEVEGGQDAPGEEGATVQRGATEQDRAPSARTFRGSVILDGDRPVKHFGDISKEILDHFASQVGVELEVQLIITAEKADGFTEQIVRTVTENARTLKFDDGAGFSED